MKELSLFKGFAGSFLFSLALSLIFVGAAQAQSGRATVKGLVKDQQGNVVAGATVTLSDQNKNFSRTQTSNQDGAYIFTAIPPGTYRLEVEAAGFKKTSISDVQAAVDTTIDVDAALEVGQVTETVNVASTTEAPLNTNDATIGTSFDRQRIVDLPLNANNVVGLLS
ncbi:MAG TPA: carboxypeptidase-like regulatory domain-containing protein, partial [Candidatus Binatia bacterium]|nr:carboxypeptidase-like regulatory domain-containing protein [Candidatus Binatia bacterium]